MSTPPPPHLGERLAFAMAESGLSRKPVAATCGVTRQAVTIWKRTGRIHRDHVPQLAKLFGKPLDWWYDPDVRLDTVNATTTIRIDAQFPLYVARELTNRHVSQDAAKLLLAMIQSLPRRDTSALPRLDAPVDRRSGADRRGESATVASGRSATRSDRPAR